jgi:hopanoid biosynthesis associated protein HpnK
MYAKYLIVNADDFGRSYHINQAIAQAHTQGILTSASLMVNGDSYAEAVEIAKVNPRLGVGLHLVLTSGKATLSSQQIPNLVDGMGNFSDNPAKAGMRYYFNHKLYRQLKAEIVAQFDKFMATGLPLDHVNGHLNIHLHPTILKILLEVGKDYPVCAVRVLRESLWQTLRIDKHNLGYKISHAIIFGILGRYARRAIGGSGWVMPDSVYGLLQSGRMTQSYVEAILPQLGQGVHEFYFHPALPGCPEMTKNTPDYLYTEELAALTSPVMRQMIDKLQLQLINFRDLLGRRSEYI